MKAGKAALPAVPQLIKALDDDNNYVRTNAAGALMMIGPDARAAIPALQAALKDPDTKVRATAADALARIRTGK